MGLLDIANKLRTTVAASKIDKATKEKNIAANKKIKEQQNAPLFEYAATHKSFKDPIESMTNPSSDYFTQTKFENKSSSFAESEIAKITKVNPATAGLKGISQENKEYIDWTSAEDSEAIRYELANNAKGSIAQKYINQFGLKDYQNKINELTQIESEVVKTRRVANTGLVKETLSPFDKVAIGVPFGLGTPIKSAIDKWEGNVPLDIRRKAKQITDAEGTSKNEIATDIIGFAATLPLAFGAYGKAEQLVTKGISTLSKSSKIAKSINEMRLTSPKLFSIANNTLVEVADYGVRKVVDSDFTSKTDLLLGIGIGGVFGSLFGGKSVKGVVDSFTRKDAVEIEKLIPDGNMRPSDAFDLIKDYKLENGFTVSEVQDALKSQGKAKLLKNKTISEDDVLMSLENGLNGSLINRTTAKRIAGVINQAKSDIDNATPTGLFSNGNPTDDGASELINDIITEFSQAGKVYTTDDAADVINGIVARYGKKYKLEEGDGDIEDLLFDIRANGNGGKLAEVDSLEGLYKLAGKKSENVKMQEIIDLRKKVEKFEQLSITKSGGKVKMDKNFGVELQKLADDANYTAPINIFKKDGAIDIEKAYKVLDDIEAHSFTNSTRFRSVMKNNEDVFMSKIGLKQKTKRGAISSVNTRIKLIDKDRKEAIKLGDDIVKEITLDVDVKLTKSQRTSIYNQMRGQLSTANSYADVKAVIKKTTQKMWVAEAKSLQKSIDKVFSESAKKLKKSVTYASYHEDVMSEVIRANEAWKATNDISHLRDGLDKVNKILKDGKDSIKEFDEARKLVVDNNYRGIIEELGSNGRVEFGYEKGIFGNPEDTKGRVYKTFTEADYPIRRIPELFGENSTGKKVFFDNLSNAQSLYFKESNKIMDDVFKLASAFDGKGDDFKYKYNLYKLYRRKLSETLGDIDAAKSYLLDSSNMKMKDGKFFYSDNTRDNLPQLSKQELERVLMEVDNLLKSDKRLIAFDKYIDELVQTTGTKLKSTMEEEYDKAFTQVENYFPYIDKISRNTSIEEGNGIGIFTNPIALYDGFTKSVKGKSGEYALELDPFVAIESVVRNQLRYIHFKKPLSEAIRTLNKLGGVEVSGSNPIDGDGIDALFKALDLSDNTKELTSRKIAPGAYRYIKQYLTDVSNGGQKSTYLDTQMSKYIYSSFLSWNTSPIISQAQSYVHMLDDGNIEDLRIAVASLKRNMDTVGEVSGYALARRETIIGGPSKAFSKDILSNAKEAIGESITETKNKWKYDKQYSGTFGKLQLIKDLGMAGMKASDGIISTNAWLKEAVRWSKENGFYTSGKFDLRAIVDKLSPEQLDNLRVSADSYMNKIMGASDAVSGKIFQSAISKWMMILGKTNANAVANTINNAINKKGGERYAYLIKYFLINSAITYGLSEMKADVGHLVGLRNTDKQFPGFLVSGAEFLGIELDDTTRNILTGASYGIQGFIPLGGGGFTLNEIFGVGAATKDKLAAAYSVSNGRLADAMSKQVYQMILGRGLANPLMQFQSQVLFGTSKSGVENQNYALSKTDLDISKMSREDIDELVGLKNAMNEDYASGKSESAIKSKAKDELSSRILSEFATIPSTQEFMQFVQNKDNKPLLIEAGLTNNPSGLKAFHNNLKLEKAKSEGEVISILGSADTEFIFNNRLKQYYDSGDISSYQTEMKFLMDKGVIKNSSGFNTWLNKNVINNPNYKKGAISE